MVEGRLVGDGTDARGVGVDADGAAVALAWAVCATFTTAGSRAGAVEGSVLGFAGSLVAGGATVGAAAAVGGGAGAGEALWWGGAIAGAMMRSANA